MSSGRGDRFPLLFVVNLNGAPLEKPPVCQTPSVRDRNVTRGAASVISRWPQHVQTSSRLAMFTAFTILCMSCFIVAVIFYTSDYSFDQGFGFRKHPRERRVAMCNLVKDEVYENKYDGGDVNALVNFMTPLPRAWEFLSDQEKIFFVMSQGDTLTPEKKCAIESAVGANQNVTVYLLVLLERPRLVESSEVADEESAFNQSVSVIYIDVIRYLEDTPLSGFWQRGVANKELKELAAKFVTLWRFGGLSLDVNVMSVKDAGVPRRKKSKNASVDLEGHVLGVRYPCHAFLFHAMKVLDKVHQEADRLFGPSKDINPGAVLTVVQDVYCRKPHCGNRPGIQGKCPGLKVLGKDVVCSLEDLADNNTCQWATFNQHDVGNKYFNDICAISSSKSQPNPSINK